MQEPTEVTSKHDAVRAVSTAHGSAAMNHAGAIARLLDTAKKHLQEGRYGEAEKIYLEIIQNGNASAATYSNMAIVYRRTNRIDEAIQLLQEAIRLQPELAEVRFNLGNALMEKGNSSAAIECFWQALHLRVDFPEALFNLGNAYQARGDLEAAIAAYNKALCLRPNFSEAMFNLGNALKQQGLLEAAIHAYQRGLAISADHVEGLFNLGMAFQEKGELQHAIDTYVSCLKRNPDIPEALYKLGEAQRLIGDHEAAAASLARVVSLRPDKPEAHCTLGIIHLELGNHVRALRDFESAASLRDGYVDAELSRALVLLLIGNLREGFNHYDWRLHKHDDSFFHKCKAHWLVGTKINSLLVVGEQGVGDQLQFCTMLGELRPYAAKLFLQVDLRLVDLLKRSMPDIAFIKPSATLDETEFDACIPMGSLCRQFRSSPQSFPLDPSGYLRADCDLSRTLRSQLAGSGEKLIGISWFSKRKDSDLQKSIALEDLAKSIARPGLKLVSLQYGDTRAALAGLKLRTGIDVQSVPSIDNFYDLDDLAALVDCCDLVVSVANVTVHLAGGLGKPTWTLLKQIPDWRWGLEGEHSLWYPSMRLFRQRERGNWQDVLVRLEGEITRWQEGATSAP